VGEEADVGGGDGATVLVAEEIFEENSEAVGSDVVRAWRRKRLTVTEPEVRVAAERKLSGC